MGADSRPLLLKDGLAETAPTKPAVLPCDNAGPLDPWITAALHGICMGHFLRGRYEDAAAAA
jgi:hypothetical protein